MNHETIININGYTAQAKGIAFDGCHKIYILLDDEQMRLMKEYGYDPLISSDEMNHIEMGEKVIHWYNESCSLRFISAVETNDEDPNAGFITVIGQFDDEDEDEYDNEDDN